jgi:hypothetical protein
VEHWTVGAAVPTPVAEVLRTARKLLVDSYRAFEYSLVAVGWALFALEVTMHDCTMLIGPNSARRTFGASISKAQRSGLITQEEANALRLAADLRNRIVHGYLLPKPRPHSYAPHDALTMLEAVHDAITDLYTRATEDLPAQMSF